MVTSYLEAVGRDSKGGKGGKEGKGKGVCTDPQVCQPEGRNGRRGPTPNHSQGQKARVEKPPGEAKGVKNNEKLEEGRAMVSLFEIRL